MVVFNKLKNLILNILFPLVCLNCKIILTDSDKQTGVCQKCLNSITPNTSLFCPVCKLRLADNHKICHKDSKYLLAAAANYNNGAIKNLIWHFKYKKWSRLENLLGELLLNYLQTLNLNLADYTVIPIPLHKNREKQRGFNQSRLLAEIISKNLNLDLSDYLKRIKNTKIQAELKGVEAREQNVKNCFVLENPQTIEGKNVLLIDDVHTTGATIKEAAAMLKSADAKNIIALVIAKT